MRREDPGFFFFYRLFSVLFPRSSKSRSEKNRPPPDPVGLIREWRNMMTAGDKIKSQEASVLLGAHFSIAKGFHNALYSASNYGCTALQIFTKNANTWKERTLSQDEIDRFNQAREQTGITAIASHTSYLINLASYDPKKYFMSCNALKYEMIRSSMLNIPFVVLHPGAHMGKGEDKGISRIASSINEIFAENTGLGARVLLETTAGQGSGLGHAFEQLSSIMDQVKDVDRLGICLDTSHIFAAGYDIRSPASYRRTIDTFDSVIGIEKLYMIHLNDSKKELGSRVDRHEHIGEGYIGINAFEWFMNDPRFRDVPKIIETPKHKGDQDCDRVNLNKLRALVHS
jgi:deoxyribonuclease IV